MIYNLKRKTGRAYYRYLDKSVQASWELRQILKARHRKDDSWFEYGDLERKVIQLINLQEKISVEDFAAFAKIDNKEASETLVPTHNIKCT